MNPDTPDNKITFACEFGMLGMPPQPGTMTYSPNSDMALFESTDGTTKTWIRRSILAQSRPRP